MYFGKIKQNTEGRVPPDQQVTDSFPVLHYGDIPQYSDLKNWDLKIYGLVENPIIITYGEFMELPQSTVSNDIHCVTGWSKLDNQWTGVKTADVCKNAGIKPEAKYVLIHAEEGWTTNLPIEDFLRETSLLAHSHNGEPLTPEHGFPVRAVVPHLYFWKSAKWVRALEFRATDAPGFWEKNGYHMYGDPWKSQRFSWD